MPELLQYIQQMEAMEQLFKTKIYEQPKYDDERELPHDRMDVIISGETIIVFHQIQMQV